MYGKVHSHYCLSLAAVCDSMKRESKHEEIEKSKQLRVEFFRDTVSGGLEALYRVITEQLMEELYRC